MIESVVGERNQHCRADCQSMISYVIKGMIAYGSNLARKEYTQDLLSGEALSEASLSQYLYP